MSLSLAQELKLKHQNAVEYIHLLFYLQGFVVPAVCPIFIRTSAVQHQSGSVGVAGLESRGIVQTDDTHAALHQLH